MATAAFDTPAITRKLTAAGFSEAQAEAVTGVIRKARVNDLSSLATEVDLETEISAAKFEIWKWVFSAIGFQAVVIVAAIVALTKGAH